MSPDERLRLLREHSVARLTALDLRRALDGATYGEVLRMRADAGLPLPRAFVEGREEQIAEARAWMLPPSSG